ncbi:MAG TPA: hypothetical protein V6D25_09925 [Leptolyngbyaceae cyanobacterium]
MTGDKKKNVNNSRIFLIFCGREKRTVGTYILHHLLIAKITSQKAYDFVGWALPTIALLRDLPTSVG